MVVCFPPFSFPYCLSHFHVIPTTLSNVIPTLSTIPLQATFAISLQQPEPATYDLFDDVVVLAEGRELYHGPRQQVLDHFNALGFFLPARKEVADFLQNLASPKDQGVRRGNAYLSCVGSGVWRCVDGGVAVC